jgi:hypothetical protein
VVGRGGKMKKTIIYVLILLFLTSAGLHAKTKRLYNITFVNVSNVTVVYYLWQRDHPVFKMDVNLATGEVGYSDEKVVSYPAGEYFVLWYNIETREMVLGEVFELDEDRFVFCTLWR